MNTSANGSCRPNTILTGRRTSHADGIKTHGCRCQQCRKPVVVIDESLSTATVIVFRCPACGHHWFTETPKFAGDILRGKA